MLGTSESRLRRKIYTRSWEGVTATIRGISLRISVVNADGGGWKVFFLIKV